MNRPNWSKYLYIVLVLAPTVALFTVPEPWKYILFYGLATAFFTWGLTSRRMWPEEPTGTPKEPLWVRFAAGVLVMLFIALITAVDAYGLTRPYADIVAVLGCLTAITAFLYIWGIPKQQKKETSK